MNVISTILSENIIDALGWTIIHSLWQGAVVALVFAVVMFLMRRSGAGSRYLVGVVAIMLILAISVVTFVSIYNQGIQGAGGGGSQLAVTDAAGIRGDLPTAAFFTGYFNRHLPLVVTLWMLGVLVLVLRLAGGYLYNQRIKLHGNQSLPFSWQNRLETFCRQAGIRKHIELVESKLVKIPMTIGHFKPVILFPLGLVSGLPQEQVEALMAHELAHILRKDYLVNILQSFVDVLFFYHPGVHWISSQMRIERENCCDDIAVSLSGDSLKVAKALTNINTGDYDMNIPVPAVAAVGKGRGSQGLLARIKRLVNPLEKNSGSTAGAMGASILAVGLLTLVVTANAAAALDREPLSENNQAVELALAADEEEEREKELQKKEKEELKKLEILLKTGKKEAEKQKKELQEIEINLKKKNRELEKAEKEKLNKLVRDLKQKEINLKKLELKRVKKIAKMQQLENLKKEKENVMQAEKAILKEREEQRKKLEAEIRKKEKAIQAEITALRKQEEKLRMQELKVHEQEKKLQKQLEFFKEVLAKELLKDNLITDINNFEIQFKKGKLYINGKKQSDMAFEKYKKFYEKTTGRKLEDQGKIQIINKQ